MVSFRKLILVMALVVINTGIALAVNGLSAPIVTCNTSNPQTARFQQENQTALLPAVTFVCQVANQLPNVSIQNNIEEGTLYDWEVFFPVQTPLTVSTYNAGKTEPQLFVDVVTFGGTDEGVRGPFYALGPTPGGIFPPSSTPPASGGEVSFAKVDMNPLGDEDLASAPDSVYITIVNLRASMLGIASNPPNYGGAMTVTVWAKPSQTKIGANQTNPGNIFLPLINGVQSPTIVVNLGYAAPSLAVTETDSYDWRQCFSWSLGGPAPYTGYQYFHVDFIELYSYAFAPPVDGWETPSLGTADVTDAQLPLYPPVTTGQGGTRLVFIMSSGGDNGWPSFVKIEVPSAVEVYDGYTTVYAVAVLVNNPDATGNGGTLASYDTTGWTADSTLYTDGVSLAYYTGPWVAVTTDTVIYEILPGASAQQTMTLEVPVRGSLIATPTVYPPPDDQAAMITIINAGYAPWTSGPVPQLTPIPRFIAPPAFKGINLFAIDPCTTNLLYPYLVSGQSWDTGVSVANTGLDPFVGDGPFGGGGHGAVTGTSNPNVYGISGTYNDQPGVCWFYFYGSFNNARGVYVPASSPVILGGSMGFASSGGTTPGADPEDYIVPGTTGEDLISVALLQLWPTWNPTKTQWNGYAIAMCDFLYAHGYAFSDFHGTAAQGGNYSLGYLALVFDQRGIEHQSQTPERMTF
jgi:hypothetical protein